jgi:mannosyl-glycoprotein endo-beta-N-acetylglucosaminidase
MNVIPVLQPPLDGSIPDPRILWANFETTLRGFQNNHLPSGTLTWDVATFFVPSNIKLASDMKPPWTLQDPEIWQPKFLYFNIYAQAFPQEGPIGGVEKAVFLGTTGLDGRADRFFVDVNIWPDGFLGSSQARLYVQGVTDRGEVLAWDHCAYVDIALY